MYDDRKTKFVSRRFHTAFVADLLRNRYRNFKIVMAFTNEIVLKIKTFIALMLITLVYDSSQITNRNADSRIRSRVLEEIFSNF